MCFVVLITIYGHLYLGYWYWAFWK
jgi:hypothetical protein